MTINSKNVFEVYKKIEKSNDDQKSSYEIVKTILNELHKTIHLMIIDIDKKKAFLISKQTQYLKDVQKSISKYVVRSLTTIYSLQTTLNFEQGGTIATNLFQLYEYCRKEIINAFAQNNNNGLKKAYDALQEIIVAWDTMEISNEKFISANRN